MNFDVHVDRVAAGGDGLGAAPDGRVVFVTSAVPGDHVSIEVTQTKKQFYRGRITEVLAPGPQRVEAPCAHVGRGCGGCDWQHVSVEGQRQLRVDLVRDAVRRIAKIEDLDIGHGPALGVDSYRTTVRAAVQGGQGGFRMRRSNRVLVPDHCLVAHPRIDELLTTVDFGDAGEVVLRVGARTGEAMVHVLSGGSDVELPDDVVMSTEDTPDAITEIVAGQRFRISGPSFFQCRPDGAEAMVALVAQAIGTVEGPLVDAYAGVGLFGATLGANRPLTSVEVASSSIADSRHNLPDHAVIVEANVEEWAPTPAAVVIADPARAGLGSAGAEVLAGTGAEVIALVSCDVASMARDLALLSGLGYRADWVRVLDLFGHTSHVEVVTRLIRR